MLEISSIASTWRIWIYNWK